MKKVFIVLSLIMLVSCQMSERTNVQRVGSNMSYFKDEKTGLCYAAINSRSTHGGSYTSITCVPCDSLKKVKVEIIK